MKTQLNRAAEISAGHVTLMSTLSPDNLNLIVEQLDAQLAEIKTLETYLAEESDEIRKRLDPDKGQQLPLYQRIKAERDDEIEINHVKKKISLHLQEMQQLRARIETTRTDLKSLIENQKEFDKKYATYSQDIIKFDKALASLGLASLHSYADSAQQLLRLAKKYNIALSDVVMKRASEYQKLVQNELDKKISAEMAKPTMGWDDFSKLVQFVKSSPVLQVEFATKVTEFLRVQVDDKLLVRADEVPESFTSIVATYKRLNDLNRALAVDLPNSELHLSVKSKQQQLQQQIFRLYELKLEGLRQGLSDTPDVLDMVKALQKIKAMQDEIKELGPLPNDLAAKKVQILNELKTKVEEALQRDFQRLPDSARTIDYLAAVTKFNKHLTQIGELTGDKHFYKQFANQTAAIAEKTSTEQFQLAILAALKAISANNDLSTLDKIKAMDELVANCFAVSGKLHPDLLRFYQDSSFQLNAQLAEQIIYQSQQLFKRINPFVFFEEKTMEAMIRQSALIPEVIQGLNIEPAFRQHYNALAQYLMDNKLITSRLPETATLQEVVREYNSIVNIAETRIMAEKKGEYRKMVKGFVGIMDAAADRPALQAFIDNFNQLSAGLVVKTIADARDINMGVLMRERWISIAEKCLRAGDFHSFISIVTGLRNNVVQKVLPPLEGENKEVFDNLVRLANPQGAYALYRRMLEIEQVAKGQKPKPIVIFSGLITQDTEFFKEGNMESDPTGTAKQILAYIENVERYRANVVRHEAVAQSPINYAAYSAYQEADTPAIIDEMRMGAQQGVIPPEARAHITPDQRTTTINYTYKVDTYLTEKSPLIVNSVFLLQLLSNSAAFQRWLSTYTPSERTVIEKMQSELFACLTDHAIEKADFIEAIKKGTVFAWLNEHAEVVKFMFAKLPVFSSAAKDWSDRGFEAKLKSFEYIEEIRPLTGGKLSSTLTTLSSTPIARTLAPTFIIKATTDEDSVPTVTLNLKIDYLSARLAEFLDKGAVSAEDSAELQKSIEEFLEQMVKKINGKTNREREKPGHLTDSETSDIIQMQKMFPAMVHFLQKLRKDENYLPPQTAAMLKASADIRDVSGVALLNPSHIDMANQIKAIVDRPNIYIESIPLRLAPALQKLEELRQELPELDASFTAKSDNTIILIQMLAKIPAWHSMNPEQTVAAEREWQRIYRDALELLKQLEADYARAEKLISEHPGLVARYSALQRQITEIKNALEVAEKQRLYYKDRPLPGIDPLAKNPVNIQFPEYWNKHWLYYDAILPMQPKNYSEYERQLNAHIAALNLCGANDTTIGAVRSVFAEADAITRLKTKEDQVQYRAQLPGVIRDIIILKKVYNDLSRLPIIKRLGDCKKIDDAYLENLRTKFGKDYPSEVEGIVNAVRFIQGLITDYEKFISEYPDQHLEAAQRLVNELMRDDKYKHLMDFNHYYMRLAEKVGADAVAIPGLNLTETSMHIAAMVSQYPVTFKDISGASQKLKGHDQTVQDFRETLNKLANSFNEYKRLLEMIDSIKDLPHDDFAALRIALHAEVHKPVSSESKEVLEKLVLAQLNLYSSTITNDFPADELKILVHNMQQLLAIVGKRNQSFIEFPEELKAKLLLLSNQSKDSDLRESLNLLLERITESRRRIVEHAAFDETLKKIMSDDASNVMRDMDQAIMELATPAVTAELRQFYHPDKFRDYLAPSALAKLQLDPGFAALSPEEKAAKVQTEIDRALEETKTFGFAEIFRRAYELTADSAGGAEGTIRRQAEHDAIRTYDGMLQKKSPQDESTRRMLVLINLRAQLSIYENNRQMARDLLARLKTLPSDSDEYMNMKIRLEMTIDLIATTRAKLEDLREELALNYKPASMIPVVDHPLAESALVAAPVAVAPIAATAPISAPAIESVARVEPLITITPDLQRVYQRRQAELQTVLDAARAQGARPNQYRITTSELDNAGLENAAPSTNGKTEVRSYGANAYSRITTEHFETRVNFLVEVGREAILKSETLSQTEKAQRLKQLEALQKTYLERVHREIFLDVVIMSDATRNKDYYDGMVAKYQALQAELIQRLLVLGYQPEQGLAFDKVKALLEFRELFKHLVTAQGRPNIVHDMGDLGLISAHLTKGTKTYPADHRNIRDEVANPNSVFDVTAVRGEHGNPQVVSITSRAASYSVIGMVSTDSKEKMARLRRNAENARADVEEIARSVIDVYRDDPDVIAGRKIITLPLHSNSLIAPWGGKKSEALTTKVLALFGIKYAGETRQLKDHHAALMALDGQVLEIDGVKVKVEITHTNFPMNVRGKELRALHIIGQDYHLLMDSMLGPMNARGFAKYTERQQQVLQTWINTVPVALGIQTGANDLLAAQKIPASLQRDIEAQESACARKQEELRELLADPNTNPEVYLKARDQALALEKQLGELYVKAHQALADKWRKPDQEFMRVISELEEKLVLGLMHGKLTGEDKTRAQQMLYFIDVQRQFYTGEYKKFGPNYRFMAQMIRSEELAGVIPMINCKSSKDRTGEVMNLVALNIKAENDPGRLGVPLLSSNKESDTRAYMQKHLGEIQQRGTSKHAAALNSPGAEGNRVPDSQGFDKSGIDKKTSLLQKLKPTKRDLLLELQRAADKMVSAQDYNKIMQTIAKYRAEGMAIGKLALLTQYVNERADKCYQKNPQAFLLGDGSHAAIMAFYDLLAQKQQTTDQFGKKLAPYQGLTECRAIKNPALLVGITTEQCKKIQQQGLSGLRTLGSGDVLAINELFVKGEPIPAEQYKEKYAKFLAITHLSDMGVEFHRAVMFHNLQQKPLVHPKLKDFSDKLAKYAAETNKQTNLLQRATGLYTSKQKTAITKTYKDLNQLREEMLKELNALITLKEQYDAVKMSESELEEFLGSEKARTYVEIMHNIEEHLEKLVSQVHQLDKMRSQLKSGVDKALLEQSQAATLSLAVPVISPIVYPTLKVTAPNSAVVDAKERVFVSIPLVQGGIAFKPRLTEFSPEERLTKLHYVVNQQGVNAVIPENVATDDAILEAMAKAMVDSAIRDFKINKSEDLKLEGSGALLEKAQQYVSGHPEIFEKVQLPEIPQQRQSRARVPSLKPPRGE